MTIQSMASYAALISLFSELLPLAVNEVLGSASRRFQRIVK